MAYHGRFMFFGEAIAFGARFDTPPLADARAAVAIPSVGGRVAASEGGYVLDAGFVRFDSAASEVVGEIRGGVYTTRATTRIMGFEVAGIIRVPQLTVTLRSRHDRVVKQNDPQMYLSVDPFEMFLYEKGRWQEKNMKVTLWKDCNKYPTYNQLRTSPYIRTSALSRGPAVRRAVPVQSKRTTGRGQQPTHMSKDQNATLWVLDPDSPPSAPLAGRKGNVKPRTRFAPYALAQNVQFYFGEYAVTKGRRRFTALRISFERSPASEIVVGELSVNGSFHP